MNLNLIARFFSRKQSSHSTGLTSGVCRACKESLRPGATKCADCGSEQRKVTLNSIALFIGAVLSVTSLSAIGLNAGKNLFDPKAASLSGAVASGDSHAIYFTVSNKGTRAATVIDVMVEGPYTGPTCKRPMTFGTRAESSEITKVIEPGKMYAIVARLGGGFSELPTTFTPEALLDKSLPAKLGSGMSCRLSVSYIDFDNSVKNFAIPYLCLPQAPCPG